MVAVPWSVSEIIEAKWNTRWGYDALAEQAAYEARLEVYRDCLTVYEEELKAAKPDDFKRKKDYTSWVNWMEGEIKSLRRALRIRPSTETVREQTRERVRRYRERQRAG